VLVKRSSEFWQHSSAYQRRVNYSAIRRHLLSRSVEETPEYLTNVAQEAWNGVYAWLGISITQDREKSTGNTKWKTNKMKKRNAGAGGRVIVEDETTWTRNL